MWDGVARRLERRAVDREDQDIKSACCRFETCYARLFNNYTL